jgi:hypothetical protein
MAKLPTRATREEVRPAKPGGAAGRDGEIIFRNRVSDDALDVPPHFKLEGFDYQWVRTSCYNEPDLANVSTSYEAGWRPVPQKAMPGYLGSKADSAEAITYRGLMLMERPMEFTIQAREENEAAAYRQLIAQHERFEVPLPENARGFETQRGSINYGRSESAEPQTYPVRQHRTGSMPID